MTSVMSYNYHGAPGGDPGMMGGYMHNFGYFPPQQDPAASGDGFPSTGSNPESQTQSPSVSSAPFPQSSLTQLSQSSGPGERRRHKLGYHRTSIACSHCRRRKIRCIASPDVQNKCVTCIRLKKDCSFYAVDQQTSHETRVKKQTAAKSSASTSTSSPTKSEAPERARSGSQKSFTSPSLPSGSSMEPLSGNPNPHIIPGGGVKPNGISAGQSYDMSKQASFVGWIPQDNVTSSPTTTQTDLQAPWQSYPQAEAPMNTGSYATYTMPPATSTAVGWSFAHGQQLAPDNNLSWGSSFPQGPSQSNYAMPQSQPMGNYPDLGPPRQHMGEAMPNIGGNVVPHMNNVHHQMSAAAAQAAQQQQVVWQHNQAYPKPPGGYNGSQF